MKLLETERLYLTEISATDAPFILELMNTPSWIKFIGDRGLKTNEDARNYILNKLTPPYKTVGFAAW